jgi:hypothetical protein
LSGFGCVQINELSFAALPVLHPYPERPPMIAIQHLEAGTRLKLKDKSLTRWYLARRPPCRRRPRHLH